MIRYKNEMKFSYAHVHECLGDACAHEMQVPKAKLNTGVLQPLPLIGISSRDLKDLPFFVKGGINLT